MQRFVAPDDGRILYRQMGHRVAAKCLDCGRTFTVNHGGGFFFHLVRCDRCGKTKSIGFDELGELHLRYLRGLPGSEYDENVRKHAPVEPISEDEYQKGIEAVAGKCRCDGKYTLDAPPRCPKCRSTRLEEGEPILMYD